MNYFEGTVQKRQMMTGLHHARDVFCKKCKSKIGWKYEFAEEESQRYKEGCLVIECAYLKESTAILEVSRMGRRFVAASRPGAVAAAGEDHKDG